MKRSAYVDYLLNWLEQQRQDLYRLDGYVLGLSGGVDSAVCAALLARLSAPTLTLSLPTAVNDAQDLRDVEALLACFPNLEHQTLSIEALYQQFLQQLAPVLALNEERVNVLRGNLMARIRMLMLFTTAQSRRAVVIGTDNAVEWHTGYFTKFGDGAADVLLLGALRKEQVYDLADYLGVPAAIIHKAPSAGLWQGQTDEDEMGVSYRDLDAFLRGEALPHAVLERIDFWHQRSHHKRMLAPMPQAWQEEA